MQEGTSARGQTRANEPNHQTTIRSEEEPWNTVLRPDADPKLLEGYYDEWAADYNGDLVREKYIAPKMLLECLRQVPHDAVSFDLRDSGLEMLDVGCGTGLLGVQLREAGYRTIDGCDLSKNMIEGARKLGIYRELIPGADITRRVEQIPDRKYALTVASGVFAGSLPAAALTELLRMTQPGGLIAISTRVSYFENSGLSALVSEWTDQGRLSLVQAVRDAPYIRSENAHYLAFRKA